MMVSATIRAMNRSEHLNQVSRHSTRVRRIEAILLKAREQRNLAILAASLEPQLTNGDLQIAADLSKHSIDNILHTTRAQQISFWEKRGVQS